MPQKLSERSEELVRQFFVDSLRPAEIEGYDPTVTDPSASAFLPVTDDWSNYGEHYPLIVIPEVDSNVIDGGQTGYTSIQGDGSGANQDTLESLTVSVQAVTGQSYRNGVSAADLTFAIYQECHHQITSNATTAISEAEWAGMTPPTRPSPGGEDASTTTWIQRTGTASFAWLNEP